MASTSGPGRYPPPIRRDQRDSVNPDRTDSVVPPHRRPGPADRSRGGPSYGREPTDGFGGGYYAPGQAPDRDSYLDPYDEPRQSSTRHRPMSQPLAGGRHDPPFQDPSVASRSPLTYILGTLALVAVCLGGFWLFTNVLFGGDENEVATAEENTTSAGQSTADVEPAADGGTADAATPDTAADVPAQDALVEAPAEAGPNDRIELTVPMVDIFTGNSAATGSIGMTMDRITGEICFGIETTGVSPPYPAHIHRGELGVKGPIAVDFTPQSDVGLSCTNVPPKNVQSILADPAGYYAEMHDSVNKSLTIRGQLSEATVTSDPGNIFGAPPLVSSSGPPTDPGGGGAFIAVENATVVLRGDVADETIAQQVRDQVAGIASNITVTDELVINPAAPLPSGIFVVNDGIEFDSGSADLSTSTGPVLDVMAALISARPEWSLYITGHTDNIGGDVPNLDLSLRRAASVRDALVARGVIESQLGVLGAGARVPKVANDTEANRAQNRRIEFEIDAG